MSQNDDTIDTLNDLIETSKDGQYGFETSAEHATSTEVRALLNSRAGQCRAAVAELQGLVTQFGGKAEDSGTIGGAVHRGWVAVRSALTSYTDLALLEECERGEDVAKARYRKALEKTLPESVRTVIDRQYQGVVANHDQIRLLRDRFRAAA